MEREGFTLIELLVVIAIITVLSAIMVPALQKGKEQGKELVCANNLRQLALEISVYSQEENTSYPYSYCQTMSSNKIGDSVKDRQAGVWWFQFLGYTKEDALDTRRPLWCPSRRSFASDPTVSGNVLCGNYGINYSICKMKKGTDEEFSGNPLRTGQVRSPFSKLLLIDSGYTLISWKALTENPSFEENPDRLGSFYLPGLTSINSIRLNNGTINEAQQEDAIAGRHRLQKTNAAFADGHVSRKSPPSIAPILDSGGNISSISFWSP